MLIRSIVIVGGGSSGWMTATALLKHMPGLPITLVAPAEGAIGVGEATIPSTTRFIEEYLGFDEKDWMPKCDATYKTSIRFNNFKGYGERVYHPFWSVEEESKGGGDWVYKRSMPNGNASLDNYYGSYFSSYHMCEANTFEKLEEGGSGHAHHMDAVKFGNYCKDRCLGNPSMTYIEGEVSRVVRTPEGSIEYLVVGAEAVSGSLFIDCSGFKSLLIEGQDTKFQDYSSYLLNDRAVVAQVPHTDKNLDIQPYTDCTALSSGWAWNTPLWDRTGTGYVYSSDYLSEEEAKEEFRRYLSERFGPLRVKNLTYRTIPFTSGNYSPTWDKNCVAMILAAGFIEPLESTGLALTADHIKLLVESLKSSHLQQNPLVRGTYNTKVEQDMEEVLGFVATHYVNSHREDTPYWRAVSNLVLPKDALTTLMSIQADDMSVFNRPRVFPYKSWEAIVIGFDLLPHLYSTEVPYKDLPELEDSYNNKKARASLLPSVYTYLKENLYGSDN